MVLPPQSPLLSSSDGTPEPNWVISPWYVTCEHIGDIVTLTCDSQFVTLWQRTSLPSQPSRPLHWPSAGSSWWYFGLALNFTRERDLRCAALWISSVYPVLVSQSSLAVWYQHHFKTKHTQTCKVLSEVYPSPAFSICICIKAGITKYL